MKVDSINTNVGIRHLRAALAIGHHGTFAAAADALGVVPSALTETIRQIESLTGVGVFDRRRRPVKPTIAGRQFLTEAAEILRQFDSALDSLAMTGGLRKGHVTVATVPSALGVLLAPALANLRAHHPGIAVTVHDGIGENTQNMVAQSQAELGLTARLRGERALAYEKLVSDVFRVVCHKDHPLAEIDRPLTLADLDRGDAVGLGPGNAITVMLAAEAALPLGLQRPTLHTHSTIAQLQLIQKGMGFALLPSMAANVLGTTDIIYLPVADLDLQREIFLIQRRNVSLSPAASLLRSYICAVASTVRATGR